MGRKLIEAGLPLAALNAAAAREKSIRRGHPSTLHLWWSRKPVGLARALLVAQILDDPADQRERARRWRLLTDLAAWDAPPDALVEARALLADAFGAAPPTFHDPFCGGGSLAFAAAELGMPVSATDVDPVAVELTRALLGADGVASVGEIDRLGRDLAARVEDEVGHAFPAPEGLAPQTWLWARSLPCPACGCVTPLLPTFDLVVRGQRRLHLTITVEGANIRFGVAEGPADRPGPLGRAAFDCLVCEAEHDRAVIGEVARDGALGRRLLVVVGRDSTGRRRYVAPTAADEAAGLAGRPTTPLSGSLPPTNAEAFGVASLDDLFTPRQRWALDRLAGAVRELGGAVHESVRRALALTVSRTANRANAHCLWNAQRETVEHAFSRTTTVPMTWLFAEAHPLADASGGFLQQLRYVTAALDRAPRGARARVDRADARDGGWPTPAVVATDPPYLDTIDYERLSSFFRPWLARALGAEAARFDERDTPAEAGPPLATGSSIGAGARSGRRTPVDTGTRSEPRPLELADAGRFATGLAEALTRAAEAHDHDLPLVLYFAYRGRGAPEGWVRLVGALVASGWRVTAVWPVRTERSGGLRNHRRVALAGSVVVVCRPLGSGTPADASPSATLEALRSRLAERLPTLVDAGVPAVDLGQAAAGEAAALITEVRGDERSTRRLLAAVPALLNEALASRDERFDAGTRVALGALEVVVAPDGATSPPAGIDAPAWDALWEAVSSSEAGRAEIGAGRVDERRAEAGAGRVDERRAQAGAGRVDEQRAEAGAGRVDEQRAEAGAGRAVGGLTAADPPLLRWLAARVFHALPADRSAAARRLHEFTSRWPMPAPPDDRTTG